MSNSILRIYQEKDLSEKTRHSIIHRQSQHDLSALEVVKEIIQAVETRGQQAVLDYTLKYDGILLDDLLIPRELIQKAGSGLSKELKASFQTAADHIKKFHELQMSNQKNQQITIDGTRLGYRVLPMNSVAVYAPGGKACYPSSVLMGLIPAQVAGVGETILVTPPDKNGNVDDAVLYCAVLAGCNKIIRAGGAQGIAAAVFGLVNQRPDLVIGPGNRFVTAAKNLLAGRGLIKIDSPAGPSEVIVIADETANAAYIAADMLSQAEHGSDSPAILLTNQADLARAVGLEIEKGLKERPVRRELKQESISDHSCAIVFDDLESAFDFSNKYAPEHLEICTKDPQKDLNKITSAGSVFLGHYAPVALGDYYSGTNHILPTGGAAHFYSGLGVDTFLKRISWQHPTKESLHSALEPILLMSKHEGFDQEHGHSVAIRFQKNP